MAHSDAQHSAPSRAWLRHFCPIRRSMRSAAYLGVRQGKFLMLLRAKEKLQRTVFDLNASYPSARLSGRSVRKAVHRQTKSSMGKRLPTRKQAESSALLPAGTPFSPLIVGCFRKMGRSGCAGWRAVQPEGSVVCRASQKPNKAVKPFACGSLGRSALRTGLRVASPSSRNPVLRAERRLPGR